MRKTSVTFVSALAVAGALAPSAHALTVGAPGVFQYQPTVPFIDSSDTVVQGVRQQDGLCAFSGEVEASDATPSVAVEELAFAPDTCEQLVRVGTVPSSFTAERSGLAVPTIGLPSANLPDFSIQKPEVPTVKLPQLSVPHPDPIALNPPDLSPKVEDELDSVDNMTADGSSACSCEPYAHKSYSRKIPGSAPGAKLRTRRLGTSFSSWEDPLKIDVAKVATTVNWRSSAGCAGAGETRASSREQWYRQTGWTTLNHNFYANGTCDNVSSKDNQIFFNKNFCNPAADTYAYIENRTGGTRDGAAIQSWNMTKSGDCSGLLKAVHSVSVSDAP
jgi:hypothetical protein